MQNLAGPSNIAQGLDVVREEETGSDPMTLTDGLDLEEIVVDLPDPVDNKTSRSRFAPQSKIEQIEIQAKMEDDSVFDDISHISERHSRPVDFMLPMHLQYQELLPIQ